jgi:ribosome biogenesis GTPase
MAAAAAFVGCPGVICINKCDLDPAGELFEIYTSAGLPTVRVSARTGEGMDALASLLAGKTSAFAGNSGVGKSSLINALSPRVSLRVGEVSGKLGRGRHTTRHVALFRLEHGAVIADTPGFSSFEEDAFGLCRKEELQYAFPEFASYLGACRFPGCSHRKEKDCAVLAALAEGKISPSRHASYVRLYDLAAAVKEWEI